MPHSIRTCWLEASMTASVLHQEVWAVTRVSVDHIADALAMHFPQGAELENQPTSGGGCWGSHWEQRLMANEVMAAVTSHSAVYSALTLAALEDSGWYRANYTMAEPLLWGRLQSCSFATGKCIINGVAQNSVFCTTSGAHACTVDHKAIATCNIASYTSSLPTGM
eukprot:4695866-Prymnesium_polylepis.1